MKQGEAEAMVLSALRAQGLPHQRRADGIGLNLAARGRAVPNLLRIRGDRLTLYALLPQRGEAEEMALRCNRVNRTLGGGCLVADAQGRAFLKQTAYLTDALYAAQTVEQALGRQRSLLEQCLGALETEML